MSFLRTVELGSKAFAGCETRCASTIQGEDYGQGMAGLDMHMGSVMRREWRDDWKCSACICGICTSRKWQADESQNVPQFANE